MKACLGFGFREEVVYLHCDGEDNEDDETGSDSELISAENNSGFITASQSQSCSIDPWPQTYSFVSYLRFLVTFSVPVPRVVMALTGFVLMMLVCHLFYDSCFNRCVMAQTIKLIWSVSEVGILLLLSYMVKFGGQGVNNEWCTLLHLLGCCLLSQAHLQSSWGYTEKKVNEAISCFFLGFPEWKYRIEKYINMKDFKIWRNIIKDPVRITTTVARQVVDKMIENYTDEDFEKVEKKERALATLTMALSSHIAQGFRDYTSTKALWEALIEVYEGNEYMKESCQDMLRQRFNMFNYVSGETLEAQLQRLTTLTTKMTVAGIFYTKSEIKKKLLNALPNSWDMNVAVIKKTKDLSQLSLAEVMAVIKASSSLPAASAMPFSQNQSFMATQAASPSNVASSSNGKEGDENLSLATWLVNCYNALVARDLPSQLSFADLD
uniref:Uncharacterized protein n=1 Tax=Lactuca sativa TaxID=4236 RepID=A0A9R1VTY1_LACSA|nr:hypothetical protein LSAT_V11C400212820 [Lactuca sativa]